MEYPKYFVNISGNVVATLSGEMSVDGTPRYTCNPKCPNNTYPIDYCMERWFAIYAYGLAKWGNYTHQSRLELLMFNNR
jgi:hypothetical protein